MSTTRTTTAAIARAFAEVLARRDIPAITALYRPDALVDVNLPAWRYQLQGPDAFGAALEEAIPDASDVTWRTMDPAEWSAVEIEIRHGEGDAARLAREVDLFRVVDGRVVEHVSYCTGPWDAATVARHAVEAPMVRW